MGVLHNLKLFFEERKIAFFLINYPLKKNILNLHSMMVSLKNK